MLMLYGIFMLCMNVAMLTPLLPVLVPRTCGAHNNLEVHLHLIFCALLLLLSRTAELLAVHEGQHTGSLPCMQTWAHTSSCYSELW